MKLSHLLLTTSLCAVAAGPLMAQSRTFSSIDTNGDRQLSFEELEDAFGRRGARGIIGRSDLDGDGFVSAPEIQVSQDDERDDDESDDDERDDDENDSDESDGGDSDEGDSDESDGGNSDEGDSDEGDGGDSDEGDSDEGDGGDSDEGDSDEGDDD